MQRGNFITCPELPRGLSIILSNDPSRPGVGHYPMFQPLAAPFNCAILICNAVEKPAADMNSELTEAVAQRRRRSCRKDPDAGFSTNQSAPDSSKVNGGEMPQGAASLEPELAQRNEPEQELRRARNELSEFLENAPVALQRIGPDGTVRWATRA